MAPKSSKKRSSIKKRANSIRSRKKSSTTSKPSASKTSTRKVTSKKRTSTTKYHKTKPTKHEHPGGVDKQLAENFISLQKVMVNLSSRFDNLSNSISKLLELFEISAKALAEKDYGKEKQNRDDKKIIEKIDNLSGQNKVIARGLTMLHDKMDGIEPERNMPPRPKSLPSQKILPRAPQNLARNQQKTSPQNFSEYQKSEPLDQPSQKPIQKRE